MKREGVNIQQLQKQTQKQINDKISSLHTKACVWGIQKFFDHKQCLKFFRKNFDSQLITHLCKFKNKPFFLIKFSQPVQDLQQFNKQHSKNKKIKVRPIQEQTMQNIKQEDFISVDQILKPNQRIQGQASPQDLQQVKNTKIQDIVEPYHNLPYQEQVQNKVKDINKVFQNYNTAFFKDQQVRRLLIEQKKNIDPLKLSKFVQCNFKRQGYRSKSEFTMGLNDKGQPIVGFNKGSYNKKTIMVETPIKVKIISKNTKLIVALTQKFMKDYYQKMQTNKELTNLFLVYNRFTQQGFWRYLIVRQSERTKQSLILLVCKTSKVPQEILKKLKQQLVQYYKKCVIGLKSLCFLSYEGEADSVPTQTPQLLYGVPYYQQKIFDHIFRVSPSAFLQIHMDMCEVLYKSIIDAVKQCDVILDLGCGIGTIGISIQKHLPQTKVIGIQICEQAVKDAKQNSQIYQVHLGRAQDHIKKICDQHRGKRIVAILDPPRAGFNKQVMIALRRCRGLDNLIYVACNAGAIQDNLLQLCLPVTIKRKAPQFIIKQAIGFDLFPQTKHFEVLYIMERK